MYKRQPSSRPNQDGRQYDKILYPLLLALAFLSPAGAATADDSKELRKQRQAAQKECQQQKNAHAREINEARRTFREYARDLKTEYREQAKDLDTGFELRRVELEADHKARVAGAEAEYQKKLGGFLRIPGSNLTKRRSRSCRPRRRPTAMRLPFRRSDGMTGRRTRS